MFLIYIRLYLQLLGKKEYCQNALRNSLYINIGNNQ